MKKISLITIAFLSVLCNATFCFSQADKSEYKISRKIKIEGDGGWDYLTVDTMYNRLFISHSTIVQAVDIKSGKIVQTITGTKGVHGITLAYDLNKGFISNGKDTSVTIFDLKSLQTLSVIKVTGNNPDAILYDSFTKRVFTFNGRSSNATVIDAATNKIIGTIALDGKPEFAATDTKGKIFVNIEDKSEVCIINPSTMKVEKCWSINPGEEPSGLAIDIQNQKLFSVCDNKKMIVSDIQSGKVIASATIGDRVDGVAFDPSTKTIFSSNGDGTVTIVREETSGKYTVVSNLKTQKGARTIAIDPKSHNVYLPTADFGEAPSATTENPHPRPSILPGTFVILEIGK